MATHKTHMCFERNNFTTIVSRGKRQLTALLGNRDASAHSGTPTVGSLSIDVKRQQKRVERTNRSSLSVSLLILAIIDLLSKA